LLVEIAVRPVSSNTDYAAWRQVRLAVLPDERAPTIEELRAQAGPQHQYVLAEVDGTLAGSGFVGKSMLAGQASIAPRVVPACRRQGVGSALLRLLAREAAAMGFTIAGANAEDAGSARFAERHGFHEVDRQIEQVRAIGDEPPPQALPGITILPVSARPELWRAAYDIVGAQAFQDMATVAVVEVTPQEWQQDWITDPDAMFIALADDEIIGCAGLMPDPDEPHRAEHALTAVRRDWRRRGVATALKRTTLAWAAANGFSEVYTWTQRDNDDMRALNTHLGFSTRSESIRMQAALPLFPVASSEEA
jgi:GNAT superfamily N-acetyltransferase